MHTYIHTYVFCIYMHVYIWNVDVGIGIERDSKMHVRMHHVSVDPPTVDRDDHDHHDSHDDQDHQRDFAHKHAPNRSRSRGPARQCARNSEHDFGGGSKSQSPEVHCTVARERFCAVDTHGVW